MPGGKNSFLNNGSDLASHTTAISKETFLKFFCYENKSKKSAFDPELTLLVTRRPSIQLPNQTNRLSCNILSRCNYIANPRKDGGGKPRVFASSEKPRNDSPKNP